MAFSPKLIHGDTLTKENFKIPPKELGILPFWFWNGELNEKEMEWQLREYHSKGIPGIFIHGRFGLKVPYLGKAWFERTKFVVEKAKEIGLDIWVYDEMNWPSGTAEKQVLQKYPHLMQKYLELVVLNVPGPLFTFLEASDSRYVNTGNSKPVAAFACTEEEFENGIENLIDLTPNLSFEKVIPWEAPPGNWKLMYFLEKEVPYYIDTMNPESTQRFLEITHEGYKTAVGKDFGTVVPGFYTDEPAIFYYHVGVDNYVVPWSKQMFKIFRERRGYDLKPHLPALYTTIGEKTSQVRYDFWRTLTEQYADTYYKQIRDWCEANGVLFTGHLLFEEWLRGQARAEGNLFKYLKQMHIIGVDHLYPRIGTEKAPDQHVALKIGSSAAHHFGSTRLLCESMGGTYWDCTLERMKWMTNWEYVLGVNLFNNHGYHYSIEGERKRDWPPSQFYHHTWWKYYDRFTTYANRLSHILSGGRHVAKVLVLYPINSIWTNYVPQQRNETGTLIERDFCYLTDTLLRLHYDFDYVDEDVLIEAKISKGEIKIADESYSVLVLPPVTHIKKSTYNVIKKFVKGGGNVIADTLLPVEFLETDKNGAVPELEKTFGISPTELSDAFYNGGEFKVWHQNSKENVFVFQGKGLNQAGKKKELKRVLNACATPDVTISDKEVFYLHRVKDGHDLYFFVNTMQEDKGEVEITFEKIGVPELWDANTGEIRPLHIYDIKKGRLAIKLDFPATESHIVVLGRKVKKPYLCDANLTVTEFDGRTVVGYSDKSKGNVHVKAVTAKGTRKRTAAAKKPLKNLRLGKELAFDIESDNVLCVSKMKMKLDTAGNGEEAGYFKPEFRDQNWLDVTPGAWELQLPQERDDESYPQEVWYRAYFENKNMPTNTRLLIDGFSGSKHRLFINGNEIRGWGKRSKIDAEIREVDIQPHLKKGRNTIAVKLTVTRRTDGILDPFKIVGDFALEKTRNGYRILTSKRKLAVGDWTKQGYPYFSGTAVYRQQFTLPKTYLSGRLFLNVNCGEDVLEVSVNGSAGHVLPWHPYRLDITDLVHEGTNDVELRVTNTIMNMLEAVEKPSGIFAEPVIRHHHVYTLEL